MSSFVPAYTREMGDLQGEQTTHLHCRNPLNTFCIRPPSERSFPKSSSITSAIHGISAVSAVVIHAISEHNVQLNTACSLNIFFFEELCGFFFVFITLFLCGSAGTAGHCLAKIWRRTVKGNRLHIYNGLNPSLLTFYVLALVVRALSCVFFSRERLSKDFNLPAVKFSGLNTAISNFNQDPIPALPGVGWDLHWLAHCLWQSPRWIPWVG